jgi:hypothetical protein
MVLAFAREKWWNFCFLMNLQSLSRKCFNPNCCVQAELERVSM